MNMNVDGSMRFSFPSLVLCSMSMSFHRLCIVKSHSMPTCSAAAPIQHRQKESETFRDH